MSLSFLEVFKAVNKLIFDFIDAVIFYKDINYTNNKLQVSFI